MNKIMVLFQHFGTEHHYWRTLGPMPYNINSRIIKLNKIGFCWTSNDWDFLKPMKTQL